MENSCYKSKLLAVAVNSDKGNYVLDIMKKAGISGCTKVFGKVCDEMSETNVSCVQQNILLSITNSDPNPIIDAIAKAALADCSLKITIMLFGSFNFDLNADSCPDDTLKRSTQMKSKMNLIVTIVNRSHTTELMTAAREAGARGGTIINARGTGTEEDANFFGISLAPEKEMLLILSKAEDTQQIVDAIKNQPIFNERGAGIVFTLNAEQAFFFNE